jgi:hypothetical protein
MSSTFDEWMKSVAGKSVRGSFRLIQTNTKTMVVMEAGSNVKDGSNSIQNSPDHYEQQSL